MTIRLTILCTVLLSCFAASGCGQQGPLYLPPSDQPTKAEPEQTAP